MFPSNYIANDASYVEELNKWKIPSGGISLVSKRASISLEVDNCTFVNNSANINQSSVETHVRLQQSGHGGAISIQLTNSKFSNVSIHDSSFDSNFAEVEGGAIAFRLNGTAKSNFNICRCNFTNNIVTTTSGGALAVQISGKTNKNSFTFESCTFRQNRAVGGGALSVAVYDFYSRSKGQVESLGDKIVLSDSSFVDNHAVWEGSALGLFSFYPSGKFSYEVEIQDW